MCAYRKAIDRSVCNYMQYHCVPFGPFPFHLGNKQMPVFDFFLPARAQYNSNFMNKISASSQVFSGMKLCKVYASD